MQLFKVSGAIFRSLILSILLLELATWAYREVRAYLGYEHYLLGPLYQSIPDTELGWALPRNQTYTGKALLNSGESVYDVEYRTDELGRRIVPYPSPLEPKRDLNLVLFGCSIAFSNGLEDQETLQYKLMQNMPGVNVVNYGVHGYGPNQLLRLLETRDLRSEIPGPVMGAVFPLIPNHIFRVIGSSRNIFTAKSPHYLLEGEKPKYVGNYRESRLIRYSFQRLVDLSNLFSALKIELPLKVVEDDIRLVAEILVEAARLFSAQFGKDLVIAVHPLYVQELPNEMAKLEQLLIERGIAVWRTKNHIANDSKYRIPNDGHPNGALNELLGAELASDLPEFFKPASPSGSDQNLLR